MTFGMVILFVVLFNVVLWLALAEWFYASGYEARRRSENRQSPGTSTPNPINRDLR